MTFVGRALCTAVACVVLLPHTASARTWFVAPVTGAIARHFEMPLHRWGPGHRGVDYVAAPGAAVAAAAAGTVTFAGQVPHGSAVTILHPDGVETTYSALRDIEVGIGDVVAEGTIVGTVGEAHEGTSGLHFGVLVDDRYVDPLSVLAPTIGDGAIHLAPVTWEPPPALRTIVAPSVAGSASVGCRPTDAFVADPPPPNDNVVVAVAGINSSTTPAVDAEIYESGPEELGYPADRVYPFSYAGTDDDDLHVPYDRRATLQNIDTSAARLRELLVRVAREHPGAEVDVIAHSMGGIVVRDLLVRLSESGEPGLPRVEHVVTFATPHEGAPLAGAIPALRERSLTGGLALAAASRWGGAAIPDPDSEAVAQLAPGSHLMRSLREQRFPPGVRVLALGIANDAIVPADRTDVRGAQNRVVDPEGLNGHAEIVTALRARALAYDFLRGAPASCRTGWDTWGPRIGAVVGFAEANAGHAYAAAEMAALAATPVGGAGAALGARLAAAGLRGAARPGLVRAASWAGRRVAGRSAHGVVRSWGKR